MTADKLASIKFAIKEDQSLSNRQRGIGLRNVMERLNSYYGEKANFQIESSPHVGTMITITIFTD